MNDLLRIIVFFLLTIFTSCKIDDEKVVDSHIDVLNIIESDVADLKLFIKDDNALIVGACCEDLAKDMVYISEKYPWTKDFELVFLKLQLVVHESGFTSVDFMFLPEGQRRKILEGHLMNRIKGDSGSQDVSLWDVIAYCSREMEKRGGSFEVFQPIKYDQVFDEGTTAYLNKIRKIIKASE